MIKITHITSALLTAILVFTNSAPAYAADITPEQLENDWTFYGMGSSKAQFRMFYMEESPGSKGVMIVSPEPYEGDVTVSYEIMPMTAASVCVTILCASDTGIGESVTLPQGYDGSMSIWTQAIDNYFFAYHNGAHGRGPFIRLFPSNNTLFEYKENVLRTGQFHQIEIRKRGSTLSFYVDGKRLYRVNDENPLDGGHIAFRLRGIPQQTASCFIRNLKITQ